MRYMSRGEKNGKNGIKLLVHTVCGWMDGWLDGLMDGWVTGQRIDGWGSKV